MSFDPSLLKKGDTISVRRYFNDDWENVLFIKDLGGEVLLKGSKGHFVVAKAQVFAPKYYKYHRIGRNSVTQAAHLLSSWEKKDLEREDFDMMEQDGRYINLWLSDIIEVEAKLLEYR